MSVPSKICPSLLFFANYSSPFSTPLLPPSPYSFFNHFFDPVLLQPLHLSFLPSLTSFQSLPCSSQLPPFSILPLLSSTPFLPLLNPHPPSPRPSSPQLRQQAHHWTKFRRYTGTCKKCDRVSSPQATSAAGMPLAPYACMCTH